ncbi:MULTISPECIES: [NiFe]-hydrogenase assembly chaperone HybE [unclassified Hyphomicrobium]|uniref:[NiFe]-hydrogenase assembly chaperone HybE n=1 Tax=unclassified Hyphomicrobium TaxID=2619925 RepID=UPI000213F756|nr:MULTISPECIES: [NiFe]-hydrogenase assembly chaperone HybE [unclassified Hyphomicrobium]CCB63683.1 putative rubredoxin hupJ [Hyphomicrobium sp. MC1]
MSGERFEGSFKGNGSNIASDTILECKICWYTYDPAVGDEVRQIRPGMPFTALPADWRCPQCDGGREGFMVVSSSAPAPTDDDQKLAATLAERPKQLAEAFQNIFNTKMRDVPFCNRSLSVEAIGFRIWEGRVIGILLAPWFMNLIILPGPAEDWSHHQVGDKRVFSFPSGRYEFLYNSRPPVGSYFACSLFSAMGEFASQLQATDVARAAIVGLFDETNREETDRVADISMLREAEIARAEENIIPQGNEDNAPDNGILSRRTILIGRKASANQPPVRAS